MKKVIWFQPLLLAALSVSNAMADHPSAAFGSETSGPINTISAIPLAKDQWALGVRTELTNFNSFSDAQLEEFAASGKEGVHSVDVLTSTSIAVGYGVSENLTLSVRIPYIRRENIREGELDLVPEVHSHGDASGIGDAVLLGQYRFVNKNNVGAALLLGVKAPTGRTDAKDTAGARQETEFQPGSGSWDLLLGAAISKQGTAGIGVHANILAQITTEGAQATKMGDAVFFNAALVYRLPEFQHSHDATIRNAAPHRHMSWDLLLEINAENRQADKVLGIKEANSGGTLVFLSPGVRFSAASKWGGFLQVGVPVGERSRGEQAGIQYRVTAGFSVAL